ncbi:MAG: hypothetical protein JNM52_01895 [Betaproteobacteria bacterium]|nr:hypothetical protein [Betaproteobacteria bacterium]
MHKKIILSIVTSALIFSGCAAKISSTVVGSPEPPWTGALLISAEPMPPGIEYKLIGSVSVDAQSGYNSAASLYPELAAEAKKIGANAIINTKGGRRVANFSWAAPYLSGTAVKVEDIQTLKNLKGTFH